MSDDEKKVTDISEVAKQLDPNASPTHFAIPAISVQALADFLEGEPWRCTVKDAVKLLQLLEGGTPLVLGPKQP